MITDTPTSDQHCEACEARIDADEQISIALGRLCNLVLFREAGLCGADDAAIEARELARLEAGRAALQRATRREVRTADGQIVTWRDGTGWVVIASTRREGDHTWIGRGYATSIAAVQAGDLALHCLAHDGQVPPAIAAEVAP